jgi:pimeloyl-ACP methyl ester carboxylesterase
VFHSPGEIWDFASDTYDASRTAGSLQGGLPNPRFLAAVLLLDRTPDAAQNLVGQREAEELAQSSLLQTAGTLVCKGDSGKPPALFDSLLTEHRNLGFNPYVLQQLATGASGREGDPHAALRANKTPAILLYPECNYLSWAGAVDYRRTLPHLKVYYIPHAGHYIQFEQPELLDHVIQAFLLDQPDAIPPYTSDADPRGSNR